ncbi:MAG: uracil-DNA glycosylase family protein [Acuticoccus sp.]
MSEALDALGASIAACRLCRDAPDGPPLPHAPRPILQISPTARLAICGQAPGNRAHLAGEPFRDPSGTRLRDWLGIDEATFYDSRRIAIVPMGFCFPGYDAKGGDLPPRRECARTWHDALFAALPPFALRLCIGRHALNYHLPQTRRRPLTDIVGDWRAILAETAPHAVLALPHPSWRNNGWLRRNPWFEAELLPALRVRVTAALA